VQVRLSDLTRIAALQFEDQEWSIRAGALDAENGLAYFGNYFGSGSIVKVRVPEMIRVASFIPEDVPWNFSFADLDPSSGVAYFATASIPSSLYKIDLGNTVTALEASQMTIEAAVEAVVAGGGIPTGTVDFSHDGSALEGCSAVEVDGEGRARCPTKGFQPGDYPIEAFYSGDFGFNPSAGTLVWTVDEDVFADDFESGNTTGWSRVGP
jgi:hypothetical protein